MAHFVKESDHIEECVLLGGYLLSFAWKHDTKNFNFYKCYT